MQIARTRVGNDIEYVARSNGASNWVPLRSLGIEAETTEELAAVSEELDGRLSEFRGEGIDAPSLECPVVRPSKILAVGLNYRDHILETNAQAPDAPMIFAKYPSALSGPTDPIVYDPSITSKLDYEGELAVVLGRGGRRIPESEALDHVFAYAVCNDVSARDLQRADRQFSRSKSFDTFCPIGPWLTTSGDIPNPQELGVRTTVNGEVRQSGNTSQMVFSVAHVISYLSQTMSWEAGDVLLTGTPAGVAMGMANPIYLGSGDLVECSIDELGTIRNRVQVDG